MRLLMMGTGQFAVPTFRGLSDTHHQIMALVTSPLRFRRSGRPIAVGPLRDIAHEHGIPILDPEDVNCAESQARLVECEPDLLVVCDYGQILSAAVLATSRLGGINLHGSLLPKYRGAAPVNWAIYHGEKESGVTVIHMTPKVDAGPCIAQARLSIDPEETAGELEARLSEIGFWLVRRAIDSVEAGRLEALPQDPALASKAPRLKKTDGLIDWSRSAAAIKDHVRAMQPWPRTYTYWHRENCLPLRLIVGPVTVLEQVEDSGRPGTILEALGDRLIVAAGEGDVAIRNLQPAGKRLLTVEEFLRGYRIRPGERFGPELDSP